MEVACEFVLDKLTPGAIRFKQTTENGKPVGPASDDKLIGALYFRKARVEGAIPEKVTCIVKW